MFNHLFQFITGMLYPENKTFEKVKGYGYDSIEWLAQQEETLLERLYQAILSGQRGQIVVKGREPINVRWDALLSRLGPGKK